MSDETKTFEESGRLRLRSALIGGLLAAAGTAVAWVVIGNLIR